MVEETKVEETKVEETVVEEPEYSEVELEVMDQGGLPKEKWVEAGRVADDWKTAAQFKKDGEIFKTLHQTKRELKQTQQTLSALQKHHQYVFDQAFRKAQAELRKERREALRSDDIDRVEEIETQLEQTEQEYNAKKTEMAAEQAAAAVQPHPEWQAWQERNDWYSSDQDLRDFADAIGQVYAKRNPGVEPITVLAHVEKEVKKKFPEKFGGKKAAPSAVAGVGRGESARKRSEPAFELTAQEEEFAKTFERSGAMTRAQYIAEIKKSRS